MALRSWLARETWDLEKILRFLKLIRVFSSFSSSPFEVRMQGMQCERGNGVGKGRRDAGMVIHGERREIRKERVDSCRESERGIHGDAGRGA